MAPFLWPMWYFSCHGNWPDRGSLVTGNPSFTPKKPMQAPPLALSNLFYFVWYVEMLATSWKATPILLTDMTRMYEWCVRRPNWHQLPRKLPTLTLRPILTFIPPIIQHPLSSTKCVGWREGERNLYFKGRTNIRVRINIYGIVRQSVRKSIYSAFILGSLLSALIRTFLI
jgi:hypothetical protein